jgi:hypothetical protein
MEAACCSEIFVTTYQTTDFHNLEDVILILATNHNESQKTYANNMHLLVSRKCLKQKLFTAILGFVVGSFHFTVILFRYIPTGGGIEVSP